VDLLRDGLDWLDRQRERFLARTIRYRRGAREVELLATIGRTVFRLDVGMGVTQRIEARDYLISAARFADLGSFRNPERGDRISEDEDGKRHTYEVLAPGGEPPWRWSDPHRRGLRIHTKYLTTEVL
jgi:hypothetical protein